MRRIINIVYNDNGFFLRFLMFFGFGIAHSWEKNDKSTSLSLAFHNLIMTWSISWLNK